MDAYVFIVINNYSYRLLLRLQTELASEIREETDSQCWFEYVDDLWYKRLPHLRIINDGMFLWDPATNRYGFQEGSESDEHSELGLMEELENDPENYKIVEDDHSIENKDFEGDEESVVSSSKHTSTIIIIYIYLKQIGILLSIYAQITF